MTSAERPRGAMRTAVRVEVRFLGEAHVIAPGGDAWNLEAYGQEAPARDWGARGVLRQSGAAWPPPTTS